MPTSYGQECASDMYFSLLSATEFMCRGRESGKGERNGGICLGVSQILDLKDNLSMRDPYSIEINRFKLTFTAA